LHALEAAGDLPAAEVLIDLIEQLVVAEHDPSVEAGALLARAIVASHRGTVRDGARLFSLAAALHRVDDRRGTLPWCLAGQAKMLAQLGDEAGATIAMEEAWDERWVDGQVFDTDLYVADAWVRSLRGDLQGAFAQLATATDDAAKQNLVQLEGYVRHEAVRLGADPGAHADRLTELAPQSQGLWDGAWAQHAVALATGDAQALEAAADAFVTIGLDLLAAEAFAEAASTWTAGGLPARAAAAAQRSRSRLELCQGAITPALTRLDKGVALLTPREIEVATRAARGLASADIAAELRLSVRTVETHLQRAFVKLGVNRRQQLADILVPQTRA
jgi:DNA-binding CsgD family transcriptional regulator